MKMSTGTYYHPGLKILPLWTVSRTDYPSVTTKLVSPPPRCDAHLGETSIHQIQILYSGPDLDYCSGYSPSEHGRINLWIPRILRSNQ